ncbi:ester cyclase [Salipiger marinus]|uniref:ester cyclase n=1 Tax=Salipiger marinus TaxID=555512 RepID=UPI0040581D48
MRGFDPQFRDYPHYLREVAQTVWNRRGLGPGLTALWHPHVLLRRPAGLGFGPEALRAEVLELTAALPDHAALTEDVIWCGAPQVGMLGAQRLWARARHDGTGVFGTASGRRVAFRMMAELYAKDNRISDAWWIRDTGAILRQLGISVSDWARYRISGRDAETEPFRPAIDQPGPYTGRGNGTQWGQAFAALLSTLMTSEFSVIPAQYDAAARMAYPGGDPAHGHGGAERFWLGLRAAFPSAQFVIHHQIGVEDRLMPPRAALRWSLTGRHDGWGPFGRPSGAEVHVMGMSHAEFGPAGLRREWTLYDEAAVWMQIHCATGLGAAQAAAPRLMAAE